MPNPFFCFANIAPICTEAGAHVVCSGRGIAAGEAVCGCLFGCPYVYPAPAWRCPDFMDGLFRVGYDTTIVMRAISVPSMFRAARAVWNSWNTPASVGGGRLPCRRVPHGPHSLKGVVSAFAASVPRARAGAIRFEMTGVCFVRREGRGPRGMFGRVFPGLTPWKNSLRQRN